MLFRQQYSRTDENGRKVKCQSRKWYGQYLDENDVRRRVPLCEDKSAAKAMLADLKRKVERRRSGLVEPSDDELARPIAEHVVDFRRHLEAKNNTSAYVKQTCKELQRLFEGCRFRTLKDVRASKVTGWLAGEREAERFGVRTSNGFVTSAKSFCNWCVADGRMAMNPLSVIKKLNPKTDVRVVRRPMNAEEVSFLVAAAAASGKTVRGLTGEDRAVLYLTAALTGLRVSELASLTVDSLDLSGSPPTVRVEVGYSKHREEDVVPLHPVLASCPLTQSQPLRNQKCLHTRLHKMVSIRVLRRPRMTAKTSSQAANAKRPTPVMKGS